jgi:hypothetical protein
MAECSGDLLNVLDFDLDAFLSDVAHWVDGDQRLDPDHYRPWAENELRLFLEEKCLLDRDRRIPGQFAVHHQDAFDYFVRIATAAETRLNVVHVDGHADLGFGDPSWVYLTTDILSREPNERMNPERSRAALNDGSYLAFLLATGKVASLTYAHPEQSRFDLMVIYFARNDPNSRVIQLKQFPHTIVEDIRGMLGQEMPGECDAVRLEPPIPFRENTIAEYQAHNGFHYAFLCQSPGFTPPTADLLINVFAEYIDFDPAPNIVLGAAID